MKVKEFEDKYKDYKALEKLLAFEKMLNSNDKEFLETLREEALKFSEQQ